MTRAMVWPLRLAVLVISMLLVSAPAAAQRARGAAAAPRLGPHFGYNIDVEEALVGAQVSWPFTRSIDLYPSFDFYLVPVGSLWRFNVDLKIRPPTRTGFVYVAAGINYTRRGVEGGSSSDTGLNLVAGIEGRRRRSTPYAEVRLSVADGSSFQLVGGFSFR